MNTAAQSLPRPAIEASGDSPGAWWRAVASLGPAPWKWAALIAAFLIVLDCTFSIADMPATVSRTTMIEFALVNAAFWLVHVCIGLCAWAIADRVEAPAERRPRRLALALLSMIIVQTLVALAARVLLLGHVDPCQFHPCDDVDLKKVPAWLFSLQQCGPTLIFGGLLFAWLEMLRRNRETEKRLNASQRERALLQRASFESRLTAMQAQVDPQFLFDSLADVQAEYAIMTARGAALLDRLIVFLRAALPSLRSEGSTVQAQVDLSAAWLDVVAARRGGLPAVRIDVGPDCQHTRLGATVLLPLVQWACGDAGRTANQVDLSVRRKEGVVGAIQVIVRVVPAPGGLPSDDVPARVRQRLRALYGDCADVTAGAVQSDPPALQIDVTWPDEGADRDRR